MTNTSSPPPVGAVEAAIVARPWLRGTLHRWAAPTAIALSTWLAIAARSGGARAAIIVYGVCISAMFLTSGTYHARRWHDRPRRIMQRLDHSMILVGIAGSYTPVIVLGLEGGLRIWMLVLCWVVAAVGVTVRLCWFDAPRWVIALVYLGAGWQMVLAFPAYADGLTGAEMALIAIGGFLYTVGAVVFALRRPNPWPRVIGFHEVFHLFVVVAAAFHFAGIASMAT